MMSNHSHSAKDSEKRVKLLFIIDCMYSTTGGTESQLVKLITHLPKHKYDLHLIALRNSPWMEANQALLGCKVTIHNIIKVKNPLTLVTVFQIYKQIKTVSPDIVMTFFPLANILGVIIARCTKCPTILSTRRDYGLWLNEWSVHFVRFANRFVKKIIANSNPVKELTINEEHVPPEKINMIYNGIDFDHNTTGRNQEESLKSDHGFAPDSKIVGIVGNLRPMKRHKTFLKAAKTILESRNDVAFVIVGDGPLRKDLENYASQLGIDKQTYFAGSQEDVTPFLSIFDIGVNCSANEGLSNAVMEYMASGIPCIVSLAGGNPDLITDSINGYTFELDNHEELAQRILNLLDGKEKQALFAGESQKRISEMSLDRMIENYDLLFTSLTNNQ